MAYVREIDLFLQQIEFFVRNNYYEAADSVLNNQSFSFSFSSAYPNIRLLHYFVAFGKEKVVQYLLSRGYNVNVRDSAGTTPMMMAAKKNDLELVHMLFAAGGDILMVNNENKSALHVLFEEHNFNVALGEIFYPELRKKFLNDEEIAQCLIDANCHLYQACCFGNSNIIEYMLQCEVPVNSADPLTSQSALHLAVAIENVDIVKLLLKYGVNTNAPDCNDALPLRYIHLSERLEHTREKVELLKILLRQDVLPTSCTSFGLFQIGPTLMNGNREAISVVLQSNVDFTAKDANESYVLHYIAANNDPGVAEELELYMDKCYVNVVDRSGVSPLHIAVKYMNIDMVQLLLNQGARSNCKDNEHGYTPLYYAFKRFKKGFESQCRQIVELLLYHDADPQFIVIEESNEPITIFDVAKKRNILNLTKPLVARLVILEELGVPITEIVYTKINSHPILKRYFNRCQKLIRKNICGSVTLIKLLNSNIKNISQYSGNKTLMLKLIRLSYKPNSKAFYSPYYNILRKKFSKGIRYRQISDKVSEVICKIFEDNLNKSHLIVNKIIDYLDDKSLQALYQLRKDISV